MSGKYVLEGVNGTRYRATGYNSYVMRPDGGTVAQTMSAAQTQRFFSTLRPNSLCRIWAPMPVSADYTWAQAYAQMDVIVNAAQQYGHRLIFVLSMWNDSSDGSGTKSQTWFNNHTWRTAVTGSASLQAWAEALATRYANNSTVAIYDLMNEPQDGSANFTTDLALFGTEMSGFIKAKNPNALVYIGVASRGSVGGAAQYQSVFTGLDFCAVHDYEQVGYPWSLQSVLPTARTLGKPVIIDEFGVWAKEQYGSQADSDKDTNGLAAVSFNGQAKLTEGLIRDAFAIDDVFGCLIWSEMDTDTGGWYDGLGRYEPVNQAPVRDVIKNVPLQSNDFTASTVAGLDCWLESGFAYRLLPGTGIGGTSPVNNFYDRGINATVSQSTQANAPIAMQGGPGGGASMYFKGTQRIALNFRVGGAAGAHQQHTFFCAFAPVGFHYGSYHYLISSGSGGAGVALRINGTTRKVEMVQDATPPSGATVVASSTSTVNLDQVNIIECGWDAVGGSYYLRLNNVQESSGTHTATLDDDGATLGCATGGTFGYFGHVLEFLHYGAALADYDAARVRGYLSRYKVADGPLLSALTQKRSGLPASEPVPGMYIGAPTRGTQTGTVNSQRLYFVRIPIKKPTLVTAIRTWMTAVGTGAGQVWRQGLYLDADGKGAFPLGAPLVDAGTVTTLSGTGGKDITISQLLDPNAIGDYIWAAGALQGTFTTSPTFVQGLTLNEGIYVDGSNASETIWKLESVSGALPSIATTDINTNLTRAGFAPHIVLLAA